MKKKSQKINPKCPNFGSCPNVEEKKKRKRRKRKRKKEEVRKKEEDEGRIELLNC